MILNILRKVLKVKAVNSIKHHVNSGNLTYGQDTKIKNAYIEISHKEGNCKNIIIGNDCNIEGSIFIYSHKSKITIGDRVFIGGGTKIICYDEIKISDDVMISWDCTIIDTNSHSLLSTERKNDVLNWNKNFAHKNWDNVQSKKISIGKNAWIGFKSIILKGTLLGESSVVAAGSVVTKNVDDFSIVGGNPAKFIKRTN